MLVLTHFRLIRDVLFKFKGEAIDSDILNMIEKCCIEDNATINLFFNSQKVHEYFLNCEDLQSLLDRANLFVEKIKIFCPAEVVKQDGCLSIKVGKATLTINFQGDEQVEVRDIEIKDNRDEVEMNEESLLYLMDYITPREIFNVALNGCIYDLKDGYAVLNLKTGQIETVSVDKGQDFPESEDRVVLYTLLSKSLPELDKLYFNFLNDNFLFYVEGIKKKIKEKLLTQEKVVEQALN